MTLRRQGSTGFTLIEVMAVIALISVIFLVALEFYTDLSRASIHATDKTRGIRRAAALLDRVARDFEGTTLLAKPPEMDPLSHPWLFVAESRTESDGADHLKFITRNHDPTRTDAPQTNLAMVAYMAKRNDQDRISLYRWSSPHLPESLEKDFPDLDDERTFLVADDLATFGVKLHGGDSGSGSGSEWDSTTLLQSGQLPMAIEIQLAIAGEHDDAQRDDSMDEFVDDSSRDDLYRRKVWLPIRPVQIAMLLDPESTLNGGTNTGDSIEGSSDPDDPDDPDDPRNETCKGGMTNARCIACSAASNETQRAYCDLMPGLGIGNQCFSSGSTPSYLSPIVRPECM